MAANRPNILIITTHDSGRHFGCYGVPTVQTPAVDRLAAEGVRFDRMFGACPICSPSRGALLTGRYPLANGLVGLAGGAWNWELNGYEQHLSHRLRAAGYHTAMFGLQHDTRFIERLGFDDTRQHGVRGPAKEQVSAPLVAEKVAAYLGAQRGSDKPFYAQVGFFETHTDYGFGACTPDEERGVWMPPYATSHTWPAWAKVLNRFGSDPSFARQHLAEFQGALRQADRAVGIILDALDATGLAEDTLVLFNTDHGPELPGAKWTLYDAGTGVAFILRWPGGGVSGGRSCDWQLGNVDFLPTLFELLDLPCPEDAQGVSFAEACRGDVSGQPSPRPIVYCNWVDGLNFSVRTEQYKLIRNLVPVDSTGRECPPHELYDLTLDPLELSDVAREPAYAAPLAEMVGHLDTWLEAMDDPTVDGPLRIQKHDDMIAEYRQRYEKKRGITRED